jgi:hypothetical protein
MVSRSATPVKPANRRWAWRGMVHLQSGQVVGRGGRDRERA